MNTRYKAIITNKRIYKEIELTDSITELKIGTTKNCNIRFSKDLFFSEFEITLQSIGSSWQISCEESIYISTDGVMKLISKELKHGDNLLIKYQDSNQEVFKISFMIDFDFEKKDYNREIDISQCKQITFGANDNNSIALINSIMGLDIVTLNIENGRYYITDNRTKYGVYVNGSKISGTVELFDYDFFSIVGFSFYLKYGKMYTSTNGDYKINGLQYEDKQPQKTHMDYPKFNRNTRIQYIIPEEDIEIKQPMPKERKNRRSIILTLAPSLAMLALVIVIRGVVGGGGTFVIYSVCSMLIGIIMSVVGYISDGNQQKKNAIERESKYREYMKNKEKEIIEKRENELRVRKEIQTSLENSIKEVADFGKRLYEKGAEDKDFLDICVGHGTVMASCKIKYDKQEFVDLGDPISLMPEQAAEKYKYIEDAPIVSQFGKSCGVGVVGDRGKLYEVMKNMTLDLTIRHFYKDVKLFYILKSGDENRLEWVRWFKHVYNDDLNIRNLMCDEESKNTLLEYLYSILSQRETEKINENNLKDYQHYVIFVFDSTGIAKHPISKYFENAKKYAFTFVFLEEYEELLPKGCTEIIRLEKDATKGTMLYSENGDNQFNFEYNLINDDVAEEIAVKLSAVYVDEVSLESELTKNITLFELLNIMNIDDMDLKERWANSQVYKSMAAPLGVKRKNEVVCLDIGDKAKAHGPHGLVAGTTGSGKSEILQSYVLSMASLFHPYDVGFVIIDFKGGGMANQFKDLPHLLGAITNIDGREINRSLLSIKAELVHRQELFSQSGVNHINDYIQLFKKGEVKEPLPHLIMIVDEFAELKAEFPDFMKEIISAARIGRTLGVHLILATQKPSGVVDNQIWSNSKFKLCLKVQTKEDSNEVIKTPLAAEIVEPGRAYFQVGNNEIFELFQSAYCGAKVSKGTDNTKIYSIYSMNTWGKRELVYTNKKSSSKEETKNQLQVMVEYMSEFCSKEGIQRLKGICLPPLEDKIYASTLKPIVKDLVEGIKVAVGIYDDPEQQTQDSLILNLSENNTYIIGSAQTGKTTMLQTLIYQIMNNYTPQEVNIYIIDCGTMSLKVFEEARHVGGVVLTNDEERATNLFKMLENIILQRKNAFSAKGLGTFRAYVEAGFTDMPQILLFIDNMTVFREHFARFEETFLRFSREGQSVGINIIATGAQANSVGFKALANFGNRIAYNCNERAEYSNLFDRCRIVPKELVGRGLCVIDKRILEFHTVLAFEGEKEIVRVENMRKFIQENANKYSHIKARPIPEVPEIIRMTELLNSYKELYTQPYKVPYAIDYSTVEYCYIDLLTINLLAILGRERSGKTNFILHLLKAIQKNIFMSLTEAYIVDSDEMQLQQTENMAVVKEYTTNVADAAMMIDSILSRLEERQALVAENRGVPIEEILKKEPLLLLVIENNGVIAEFTKDKALQLKMNTIIKQYKKLKVAVIFSNVDNAAVAFSSPEMLKTIKENKKFVLFDEVENIKLCDISPKIIREYSKPIKVGDAYILMNNDFAKVKTIFGE